MKTHIVWFCIAVIALIVGIRFARKEVHIIERQVDVEVAKKVLVEKPVELIKATLTQAEEVVERKALSTSTPRRGTASERQRLHQRYHPFLARLGLSPEQMERFIDLKIAIAEAHNDLQIAVANNHVPGGSAGVAALRTQLTKPYWDEIIQLLGVEGYKGYAEFEQASAFISMAQTLFQASRESVSEQHLEQIAQLIFKNRHAIREKETDISMRVKIDWSSVARDAENILTPSQLEVIHAKATQEPFP